MTKAKIKIKAKDHLCIDTLLQKKNLKKTDLAQKLGVNRQTLHSYLDGNITIENILKIAEALNVEPWELFNRSSYDISGFIKHKGETYTINSKQDLQNLLNLID